MNISFVLGNNSNQLSGGYKVIFQYANYLQNHGNSVTIIFLADRTLTVLPNYIPVSVKKAYAKIKNLFIPTWFPLNKDIKKEDIALTLTKYSPQILLLQLLLGLQNPLLI